MGTKFNHFQEPGACVSNAQSKVQPVQPRPIVHGGPASTGEILHHQDADALSRAPGMHGEVGQRPPALKFAG